MSMTVSGMAQSYYNLYNFSSSQTYQQDADSASSEVNKEYKLSSLTNALDNLNSAVAVNPFTVNLDSYVQNSFSLSQLSEYGTLSDVMGSSGALSSGSAADTASRSYLENQLGLNTGSFDINSVLNTASTARLSLLSASLLDSLGGSSLTSYQNYINQNTTGSLLDVSA